MATTTTTTSGDNDNNNQLLAAAEQNTRRQGQHSDNNNPNATINDRTWDGGETKINKRKDCERGWMNKDGWTRMDERVAKAYDTFKAI